MILLCSDYDGTLHFKNENDSGYFKPEDLKEIKIFQEKGNLFSLCTGRIIDTIQDDLIKNMNIDYAIASTGGAIFDENFKDFFHQKIDFDSLKSIYQNYHHLLSFYYHIEGHPYSVINNGDFYENRTEINSIDELENKDITGVSVYADTDEKAKAICAELNEKYPLVNVFQNNSWLDIVDKNISKGISALKLKELTKADIMCGIGDSYNDIELLKAADISFCFDYSPIEVKNEADYIVDSVCEAIKIILQAETGPLTPITFEATSLAFFSASSRLMPCIMLAITVPI